MKCSKCGNDLKIGECILDTEGAFCDTCWYGTGEEDG